MYTNIKSELNNFGGTTTLAIRPPLKVESQIQIRRMGRMLFRSGALALMMLGMASASRWASVPMAPADPILGVGVAFSADPAPTKVNLGIGAYRDNEGKPLVPLSPSTPPPPPLFLLACSP